MCCVLLREVLVDVLCVFKVMIDVLCVVQGHGGCAVCGSRSWWMYYVCCLIKVMVDVLCVVQGGLGGCDIYVCCSGRSWWMCS